MRRTLVLAVLCAGCGDNVPGTRVVMHIAEGRPDYATTPFPTDALREGFQLTPIGGLDTIIAGHTDLLAAHVAALDGWGLRPAIEFFLDGAELDPATIPATTSQLSDPLVVVNVDPNSPAIGEPFAFDWIYDPSRGRIAGAPHAGTQLAEGIRYAAVLTYDVHAPGRGELYAGETSKLSGDVPARWQTTADAYQHLEATPELAGRIAGITVFTTQKASDGLVKARNAIVAYAPAPTLAFPDPRIIFDSPARLDALMGQATRDTTGPRAGLEIWGDDNPTGVAHDHVAVVATGTTTIVQFKSPPSGSNGPDDKTFVLGTGNEPVIQGYPQIPITFVLPTAPMPASGYPVVILCHGLGASRADVLSFAEMWTSQGYAIVAIDLWGHGSRYDPTDNGNNLAQSKPNFTGVANMPDGFGDNTGYGPYIAFFENFEDISAIRDSIRQSALDFTRVATLLQTSPDLSALAGAYGGVTPKLDAKRVAYAAESLGTLVGTAFASIEPSVDLFVLNVAGGGIVDQIVPNSPNIGTLALPIVAEIYRTQLSLDRFSPLVGLLQAVLDGGDSLTYAPHVLANKFQIAGNYLGRRHVVVIEAVGDETLPNQGTDELARQMHLALLEPDLVVPEGIQPLPSPVSDNFDSQTAVVVQYAPATHGANWKSQHGQLVFQPGFPFPGDDPFPKLPTPRSIDEPIYETQAQIAQILATHWKSGGAPVVQSTKPPVPY